MKATQEGFKEIQSNILQFVWFRKHVCIDSDKETAKNII